jgi:hypothetical protein
VGRVARDLRRPRVAPNLAEIPQPECASSWHECAFGRLDLDDEVFLRLGIHIELRRDPFGVGLAGKAECLRRSGAPSVMAPVPAFGSAPVQARSVSEAHDYRPLICIRHGETITRGSNALVLARRPTCPVVTDARPTLM